MRARWFAAFKEGFRSLHNRNYRLFFFGQTVSLAGTWMQDVAQAWLILRLTDSPLALGTMIMIRFLPMLGLSLFSGVVVDRFPKRSLLLVTQSVMLVQALVLAGLTSAGLATVGLIYLLSGIRGVADALDMPTRQSFVVEMVGPQDVPNAVALNSTMFNIARIAGPALGGVLVATVGTAICFYVNAASFLAVLVALVLMRTADLHSVAPRRDGRVLPELVEGLRYARRTPDVFLIIITLGFLGTFGYNFNIVVPLIAKYVVDSGPAGLGALTAAMGVGSLVAALFLAYRSRPSRKVLLLSASLFTLLWFCIGLSSRLVPSLILLFLVGSAGVVFMTTCNIRLQLLSPAHLRGRMMALYSLLFVGTTPISSELIGFMAERIGVRESIVGMSALCLLGVLAGTAYARRSRLFSLPDLAAQMPAVPKSPVMVEAAQSEATE